MFSNHNGATGYGGSGESPGMEGVFWHLVGDVSACTPKPTPSLSTTVLMEYIRTYRTTKIEFQ